jgi:choline-sulfatase
MVEQTDRRIGTLLQAFEEAVQDLSEWIIVFTADHGEMLGQHGLWGKRKFYEGSARIPLFVSAPGLTPSRSTQPCNLVDLFPTLTRLAGLPEADGLDGLDLFAPDRPEETFCQHERDQFMVRSGNFKYLRFADMPDVLFDLAADPGETHNLAADPAYAQVAGDLREKLAKFAPPTCERSPSR